MQACVGRCSISVLTWCSDSRALLGYISLWTSSRHCWSTQGVPASYYEFNRMQQHPIRGRYQPTCSTTQHGWAGEEYILLCRYDVGSFHCPWWASAMLLFKCRRWLLLYGMCKAKPNVEDVPDHTIQTKTNQGDIKTVVLYTINPTLTLIPLFC